MFIPLWLRALLFTALICAGANVEIDLGPVPFIMSDFFVLLAGLILGSRWAVVSLSIYLLLGIAGLPVFAGGEAGLTYFTGPTCGYLIGFLFAAFVAGKVSHQGAFSVPKDALATLSGQAIIFGLGVPWLKFHVDIPWETAISKGFSAFLVPIVIKFATVVLLAQLLRRLPGINPNQSKGRA